MAQRGGAWHNAPHKYQRCSRGHKAPGQGHKKDPGQGQEQPFRGQTLSRPRTQFGSDLQKKGIRSKIVVVNNLFHEQRKKHKIYQSKQTTK